MSWEVSNCCFISGSPKPMEGVTKWAAFILRFLPAVETISSTLSSTMEVEESTIVKKAGSFGQKGIFGFRREFLKG
ncbi:hypothetical protein CRYUN_Cryun25bG0016600 [Craigia yunnanensis]